MTAIGAMEKSWSIRAIERKEVRKDDPINTFSLRGSEIPFEFQRAR